MRYTDPDGRTAYAIKAGHNLWKYDYSSSILWDAGRAGVNFGMDFLPSAMGLALKLGNIGYGKLVGIEILNDCANWVDDLISGLGG